MKGQAFSSFSIFSHENFLASILSRLVNCIISFMVLIRFACILPGYFVSEILNTFLKYKTKRR